MYETDTQIFLVYEDAELVKPENFKKIIDTMSDLKDLLVRATIMLLEISSFKLSALSIGPKNIVKTKSGILKFFNFSNLTKFGHKMDMAKLEAEFINDKYYPDPAVYTNLASNPKSDSWAIGILALESLSIFNPHLKKLNSNNLKIEKVMANHLCLLPTEESDLLCSTL